MQHRLNLCFNLYFLPADEDAEVCRATLSIAFLCVMIGNAWSAAPNAEIQVGRTLKVECSAKSLDRRSGSHPHVLVVSSISSHPLVDKWKTQLFDDPQITASFLTTSLDVQNGFPPAGDAYLVNEPQHALWRWMALQSVDLVVVVTESSHGSGVKWTYSPSAKPLVTKHCDKLIQRVAAKADRKTAALCAAAATTKVAGVGEIPAVQLHLPAQGADVSRLSLPVASLRAVKPSPAAVELAERVARRPEVVIEQMANHYGNQFQLHYIPALAAVSRLRYENSKEQDRLLLKLVDQAAQQDGYPSPRNGSEIAGRLLLAQMHSLVDDPTRRANYLREIQKTADLAFHKDGTAREAMPFHADMSDAVFMSGPLLAEAGRLTKQDKYFDACARHVRFMQKLCLREDGLYRHHPGNEAAWGRGNGFPALGLALVLSAMPVDHPGYPEIKDGLLQHLRALAKYQGRDGCWHQIIDRDDAYREMTSTCMILFAMKRASRNGWGEPKEFDAAIDRAWRAVKLRVKKDGTLINVCTGTGKQKQFDDYYRRKAILGKDDRGGAMVLMAATEMAATEVAATEE